MRERTLKVTGSFGGGGGGNEAALKCCFYACTSVDVFVFLTGPAWHRWNPWSSGSERREGTDFLLVFFYGATYIV